MMKYCVKKFYMLWIYAFTCAGYVSLYDEMFSYANRRDATHKLLIISMVAYSAPTISSKMKLEKSVLTCYLGNTFHKSAAEQLSAFMDSFFLSFRVLMQWAKELPERHRARLRFCSD